MRICICFFWPDWATLDPMSNLMRAVRAVLWSFIGLGGRRADADKRTAQVGILPLIGVAFVMVLLLIAGLLALAHYAAGT
ncbi:Protein of unknown function [Variovorax sp. OV084]|nr:Protein of unknown function [Variovorax sp. YR266]SET28411.1 Protein of unknown function [Variovorax sp. OV084]